MTDHAIEGPPVQPVPPVTGWNCSTGIGKSYQLRQMAASKVRELRCASDDRPVVIFIPIHKLGEEQVEKFRDEQKGITVRRYLGIAQKDPDRPENNMCRRLSVAVKLCQNGASMRDICSKPRSNCYCPHHVEVSENPCGYSIQGRQNADVWFLPQQLLFSPRPNCIDSPAFIGIDESFWQSSLEGFASPYRFRLETLAEYRSIESRPKLSAALSRISLAAYNAISKMPYGFMDADLINEELLGHGEHECVEAHRYELKRLSDVNIKPDMSNNILEQKAEQLSDMAAMRLAKFWFLLKAAIAEGGVTPFINKSITQDNEGTTIWIYLYNKKEVHPDWHQPTILIDASLPETINRLFYPQLIVEQYHCPMQNTTITQVTDKTLSKAMLLPSDSCTERKRAERLRNVDRLMQFCNVLVARTSRAVNIKGQSISLLLVTYKDLEEMLNEIGLSPGITTLHFGATSGLDAYRDVPCMVIAGRLELPLREAEHQASVLTGRMVEQVPDQDRAWYPLNFSAIETPDNIIAVSATSHPDPLVEGIRWSVNEGQLIQSLGRGRGVRRTASNPLEIYILTNVPLPIVVDHVVEWGDVIPSIVEQVLADAGVAPLSPSEMVRTKSDILRNADHAKRDIKKFTSRYLGAATKVYTNLVGELPIYNTNRQNAHQMRLLDPIILVDYTRDSKGAKPCRAVIRKGHGAESGKSALEKLIGSIKHYRITRVITKPWCRSLPSINKPTRYGYDTARAEWRLNFRGAVVECGLTSDGRWYFKTKRPLKKSNA